MPRPAAPRSPVRCSAASIASIAALAPLVVACSAAPAAAPAPCAPTPPAAATATVVVTAPSASAAGVSAAAERPGTQAFKDAVTAGFCDPAALQATHDEIDAIAKLVHALPKDASPANPVTERIILLHHGSRCYGYGTLARDFDAAALKAARAWSVVKWWGEGGETFLRASLEHANAIHFAPSVPDMIAAELLPAGDPLRAVVCPSSTATCDPVAQGAALDLDRELERVSLLPPRHGTSQGKPATAEGCAALVKEAPKGERLSRFVACVDGLRPRRARMPEARYRSPKGWLVLRGRRGHYNFCDEARAYDLETGTAYIASRCGGLVLKSGGSVDQDATRDTGAVKTQVGTLSVDALRRLALVLWLKDRWKKEGRPYAEYPLPLGVPVPEAKSGFGFGYGSGWAHSGQTSVHFEVVDGTATVISGTFRWPDAAEIGDQVADDLVVSAEATLKEGCPKVSLPAALAPASSLAGVSGIDASADALRKNADDLSKAFAELRKIKVCRK